MWLKPVNISMWTSVKKQNVSGCKKYWMHMSSRNTSPDKRRNLVTFLILMTSEEWSHYLSLVAFSIQLKATSDKQSSSTRMLVVWTGFRLCRSRSSFCHHKKVFSTHASRTWWRPPHIRSPISDMQNQPYIKHKLITKITVWTICHINMELFQSDLADIQGTEVEFAFTFMY